MKQLLILGAGTSGTMMANHLVKKLPKKEWEISIIDQYKTHYYQPGFLFLPFDIYKEEQVKKVGKKFIPKGVNYIQKKIEKILPEDNKVELEDETLNYDVLIIATGSKIAPQETEGLLGPLWRKDIFDFYTYEGALALRDKLREWEGGKLVVHITEMPIKCPVAPLEFAFLADSYFRDKGMRDKVDITYVTPLSGAFTKPTCTKALNYLLEEKGIKIETDFAVMEVDNDQKQIVDYAEKAIPFDLLVTIPTNMGDEVIERSGLGDDLNFVPTNKHT
jgi:sulfide:quinone oxidoreductase